MPDPIADALREAVQPVVRWLRDNTNPPPDRQTLAKAVRVTARALAAQAPGRSVEVRIPPFVAVQCIAGPKHTRGTPPNVVETDPRTWLQLVAGLVEITGAAADGRIELSGSRAAEIAAHLPLVSLGAGQHFPVPVPVPVPVPAPGDTHARNTTDTPGSE